MEIPLDARFGVRTMRVDSIGPERVVLRAELIDGGDVATVSCRQSTADTTPTSPASVTADCETGGSLTLPQVSVGVAVIREMPRSSGCWRDSSAPPLSGAHRRHAR
ncbi:MAG: hypothetical protein ACRDXB_01215 [Actinomycetes bacterium]